MTGFCFFALFGIGLACTGKSEVAADSFCTVYEKAVRNELRLTDAELRQFRALPRGFRGDVAALKETYRRRCSQSK